MFGFRTPARDVNAGNASPTEKQTKEAGPPQTVRRSIGEIEAKLNTTTDTAASSDKAPAPSTSTGAATEGKKSPKLYANKTAEARALLEKGKYYIGISRNIKTEIKTVVTETIERLYEIVRDFEKQAKPKITTEKAQHKVNREDETSSALIRKIEEHSTLLKECAEETGKLREEIKSLNNNKLSYAQATVGLQAKQPPSLTMHSIAITSTNEQESSEEILQKIRTVVDAKKEGFKIDRIRKARDQKVIIGCRTKEEKEKIRERIQKAEELKIEEMQNKDPLVKLKDVLNYNTDEEILQAIRTQNSPFFTELGNEDRMEVKYKVRTRNPHTNHIVLKVSPKIWQSFTAVGKIHIDLQRIKVEDQSPLVQCTRCLGYGHGKKYCKEDVDKCSHCGGPHMKIDCQKWKDGQEATCCNCKKDDLIDINHNAFDRECSVRKKWDRLARSKVAYC